MTGIKIEKVIKGLECCKRKDGNGCKVCPYTESVYCVEDMATDALELLKEQQQTIEKLCNSAEITHSEDHEEKVASVNQKINKTSKCKRCGLCEI